MRWSSALSKSVCAALPWIPLLILVSPWVVLLPWSIYFAFASPHRWSMERIELSLALALLATVVAALPGVPLGLSLAVLSDRAARVISGILVAAVLLPLEFHAMTWLAWLGVGTPAGLAARTSGIELLAYRILNAVPCVEQYLDREAVAALLAAAFVHGLWGVGLTAVGVAAACRRLPRPLLDASMLDCSSTSQVLRHVVLPTLWPAIGSLLLVVAASALTEIAVVDLVQLRTLADDVYVAFQLEANPGRATAVACPLFLVSAVLAALLVAVGPRGMTELVSSPVSSNLPLRCPLLVRLCIWTFVLACAFVTSVVPYAGVLVRAFARPTRASVASGSVGILRQWAGAVMETAEVLTAEFAVSLFTCATAALVATIISFLLFYSLKRGKVFLLVLAVAVLLAATPGPVLGLAVVRSAMWIGGWFYDSYGPLIWGLALRCLPLSLLVAMTWRLRLNEELLEAAALDGASTTRRMIAVCLPLSRSYVAIAFVLALVVALGDVGVSVIVAPPGTPPLTVRVFSLLHYGLDEYVAGIAFWSLAAVLVCSVILLVLPLRGASRN